MDQKSRTYTTHIIDSYKYLLDIVYCLCGWKGNVEEYNVHKKEAPPLDKNILAEWRRREKIGRPSIWNGKPLEDI